MRSYARQLGGRDWFLTAVWPATLAVHVQACHMAGGPEQVQDVSNSIFYHYTINPLASVMVHRRSTIWPLSHHHCSVKLPNTRYSLHLSVDDDSDSNISILFL